jgi:nitrite reductase/ring-hydroxylating ferredoxin subunit/uncharacterized membrane protein
VTVARFLARLVSMNDGWARPFGEFNHRWTNALFRAMTPIRDLLQGRWLGHPLHAASTDIPIGMLLGSVVLDVIGQPIAADVTLVLTILFMVASALAGLADYSETQGTALTRATLHATLMTVALVLLIISALLRAGSPTDRALPIALSIIGFLIVTASAYIAGDVVYVLGNMVSRHAFRGAGTKWIRLDTGEVTDLAQLPEATPTKMRAGINDLLVVRVGDRIHALHAVCAHAGGPLPEGRVVDDCIECPWHFSRFRLTDGLAKRGPTVYDEPAYEVRSAEGGGYEVRRLVTS